jgi:hypothetical protein
MTDHAPADDGRDVSGDGRKPAPTPVPPEDPKGRADPKMREDPKGRENPTEHEDPKEHVEDDAPLIPDRSSDDSDVGWGDGDDSNDERLRRDVPPHW